MSKLYIIGNGFDLAHGLKTEYINFREYLLKTDEQFVYDLERLYGFYPFDPDDYHIPLNLQKEVLSQHNAMIEKQLWQTIEDRLGNPDEGEIQSICEAAADGLKDIEFGVIEDTLNAHYEDQFRFVKRLQEHLLNWAKQIDLCSAKVKRNSLRNNSEDWFFTFNYTPVLENVYGIQSPRICHIHGGILSYDWDNRPVIGHGNSASIKQHEKWQRESADKYDEIGSSINKAFVNIYQETYKNVDDAMLRHSAFFKQLKNLDEISVIGHSVNKIDLPYYKKLHMYNPAAKWNVYYHVDEEKSKMAQRLREIGIRSCNIIPDKEFWDY